MSVVKIREETESREGSTDGGMIESNYLSVDELRCALIRRRTNPWVESNNDVADCNIPDRHENGKKETVGRKPRGKGRLLRKLIRWTRENRDDPTISKYFGISDMNSTNHEQFLAPFRPTHRPKAVAKLVCERLKVRPDDILYELGCGDGAVLTALVNCSRCTGVGVELSEDLASRARRNVTMAELSDRVRIDVADFRTVDLTSATVIYLYIVKGGLESLSSQLRRALSNGTRIASYTFPLPRVVPTEVLTIPGIPKPYGKVYLYK